MADFIYDLFGGKDTYKPIPRPDLAKVQRHIQQAYVEPQEPTGAQRVGVGMPVSPQIPQGIEVMRDSVRPSQDAVAMYGEMPDMKYELDASKQTSGVRNKNPFNVKTDPKRPWLGVVGEDERGHAIFSDPLYSTRAALINLRSYANKHGLRSLNQIFERYAPSSDTIGSRPESPANNPNAYAQFVAKRMGIKPDEDLGYVDPQGNVNPDVARKLLSAIAEYENYAGFQLPQGIIEEALKML